MAKRKANTKPFWRMTFLIYVGIMIWLLFFRSRSVAEGLSFQEALKVNTNLTPFYTIDNYIHVIFRQKNSPYFRQCVTELFGNILLFIPAGWLLPKIFPTMRRFFPFLAVCIGVILSVETLQLVTLLGRLDVDDIILNITGMVMGYILYILTHKK